MKYKMIPNYNSWSPSSNDNSNQLINKSSAFIMTNEVSNQASTESNDCIKI